MRPSPPNPFKAHSVRVSAEDGAWALCVSFLHVLPFDVEAATISTYDWYVERLFSGILEQETVLY